MKLEWIKCHASISVGTYPNPQDMQIAKFAVDSQNYPYNSRNNSNKHRKNHVDYFERNCWKPHASAKDYNIINKPKYQKKLM